MKQFGVTTDRKDYEWFDTLAGAVANHEVKQVRYEYMIVVYSGYTKVGTLRWNPADGFFPTGYYDDRNGVDLFEQHGIYEDIREVLS